jgi:hypothetical protein
MRALGLLCIPLFSAAATADVPKLIAVDTGKQPLKLSAPAGWRVHVRAPRDKELSPIASITPDCAGGPDISVTILLDQITATPAQVVADQYKRRKRSTKVHGWDCITEAANHEVMCAGTLKGLTGVVSAYFATTDAASYQRFGDPTEFTVQVAASLSWKGKLAELSEWTRDAGPEAQAACK